MPKTEKERKYLEEYTQKWGKPPPPPYPHSDAEALQAAVAAEQATKKSLDLTLAAQQLGAVTYLQVLTAQQAYRQALLTRVQAQAARLSDVVMLFQALGGGWWNRPDHNVGSEYGRETVSTSAGEQRPAGQPGRQ